jgi:predicted 2-oxoglutarate/Fe(II)-dependent dioxygenase YbiX
MVTEVHPIKPTYIAAGSIAVYENAWDEGDKTINSILEITKDISLNVRFSPSQTNSDPIDTHEQSRRTSQGLSISRNANVSKDMKLINNKCYSVVFSALNNYKEMFKIEEEIKSAEFYGLLRYSGGEQYGFHYDGGTVSKRSISVLIYLNDDYEGGEIEFPNFKLMIKPKAGTLILFPSNYAYGHIAHPVTSGTKYVIVTWLHDR